MHDLIYRPRRLRQSPIHRRLVQETTLSVNDLIYPLFVCPGHAVKTEIPSMPGQYRLSIDQLVEECRRTRDLG
ncbi:MAG: porphobilinogen synthase, partial [Lentisphaerae bacterium]|nr:porphobilinogen synthase [Lentisphaerota bacterium]